MKTQILLTSIMLSVTTAGWSQTKIDSIKGYVYKTDTTFKNSLITERAFNLLLQKKTSYYLSGVSEINLSRYTATYTSDNDKFNFGVNFRNDDEDEKLRWLFTSLFESNIKKNFTTLYKNDEWQSDIRFGVKFTWFWGGKLKYKGMDYKTDLETNLIIVRNLQLAKIIKKHHSDEAARSEQITSSKSLIQNTIDTLQKIAHSKPNDPVYIKTKAYLNSITDKDNDKLNELISAEYEKSPSLDDYKNQIALAEVERLYKRDSYTWFRNYWISAWGFYPFKERKTFIATDNTISFEPKKLNLWEANLQGNTIWEYNNTISLYGSVTWKIFQNNSAIADLMTSVDYYQYSQFPQTEQSNLAVLENNKGYIGDYNEFITNNFSLQFVVSLSNTNKDGKEKLVTPGISVLFEKNMGIYNATNFRFGIPLRFRGKSTPINIEPQIRLNDISNYSNKADFKVKPVIGINIGLPIIALFK